MRSINRDIVGAVIRDKNGKIFFGLRSAGGVWPGTWHIPGGGIGEGETAEKAINREVKEELGIDISQYPKLLLDDLDTDEAEKTLKSGETVWVKMLFITYQINLREACEDIKIIPNEEFSETIWTEPESLKTLNLPPPSLRLFKKIGLL